MKQRHPLVFIILLTSLFFSPFTTWTARAQTELPVTRAVLFYSPICGHCHIVIWETLPSLLEKYGNQLEVIGIDVTQPQGQILFDSARQAFGLETAGVPFLVIGDEYLVGSYDIPSKSPTLIEKYLAEGGVDWPAIPGLSETIEASETTQAPSPTPIHPAASSTAAFPATTSDLAIIRPTAQPQGIIVLPQEIEASIWQRLMLDPIGNGLAIAVLLIMIGIFIAGAVSFRNILKTSSPAASQFPIPLLCIAGLAIAGYLAYVEITRTAAVCGPIGHCNAVQQSGYAYLFGFLPIGVLGVIGYLLILLGWGLGRARNELIATLANLTTFGLATFGITFSIYLTFLEPFVIGATCAWCIASSVIMTILFILILPDGRNALLKTQGLSL